MKNDRNYEREMQEMIAKISSLVVKPKLLLHACCAPCASAVLERLKELFDITLFFYNPNMDNEEEYSSRANEVIRLANFFGVKYKIEEYNKKDYDEIVVGLESEKEGGVRCKQCFDLRLNKSADYAKKFGYEYFATTLTISPLKNAKLLNELGESIAKEQGVKYLVSDFKKKNGYIRSIELSKQLNLYRQNYCGCEFSKRD